ncbi:MAG: hypothetical protein N2C14_01670, partial [Planctomycetales bacterium]
MSDETSSPDANAESEPQAKPGAGWRRIRLAARLLVLAALLYLLLYPSPIDPAAFTPLPKPDLAGALEVNQALTTSEILAEQHVHGAEDVAVDALGNVYGGEADGKIKRISPDGQVDVFADTQGRPLGMHFNADGDLIVCDARKGLLSIDPQGKITVLATQADGLPLVFTNDVDVAADG